jgi:peptidoglycan/LPS O-acetylase OafA/YrhL
MAKGSRFIALDGLRGVAAIMVMLLHATRQASYPSPVSSAYLAVDLFFLLSGFVLAHAYGARLAEGFRVWRDFMGQRFLRLWPLYIAGLLAGLLLHLYGLWKGWNTDGIASVINAFMTNAAFLPAIAPLESDRYAGFPFNPPSWSLFSEIAVNVAFAYFARFPRLAPFAVATVVSGVLLIVVSFSYQGLEVGPDLPHTHLGLIRATFSFFLGVLIYQHREPLRRLRISLPLPLALAILAFVCMVPSGLGMTTAIFDLVAVMVVFPALLALSVGAEPRGVVAGGSEILGKASYPLYIIHWPLLVAAEIAFLQLDIGGLREHPAALMAVVLLIFGAALALGYADDWLRKRTRALITPSARSKQAQDRARRPT